MDPIDAVVDFFNSQWIVALVTSLAASGIVFFITNFFSKKHDDKKYAEQIERGNGEVTAIFDSLIADDIVPDAFIIESLISDTARRYGVPADSLIGVREAYQGLLAEVFRSTYLPAAKKEQYGAQVEKAIVALQAKEMEEKLNEVEVTLMSEKARLSAQLQSDSSALPSRRVISMLIAMLSAFASVFAMFMTIPEVLPGVIGLDGDMMLLSLIAAIICFYAAALLVLYVLKKKSREDREDAFERMSAKEASRIAHADCFERVESR